MITQEETEKYSDVWQLDQYMENSPGKVWVPYFLEIAKPEAGASIIDVGAGSGAASRELADKGFEVEALDLTDVAWNHADIPLTVGSVWGNWPFPRLNPDYPDMGNDPFDYAFCCDVMEHIPPEFTMLALARIFEGADNAFFSISFMPDVFGRYVGRPLHLTVQPFGWWLGRFMELSTHMNIEVAEARDCLGEGLFYIRRTL